MGNSEDTEMFLVGKWPKAILHKPVESRLILLLEIAFNFRGKQIFPACDFRKLSVTDLFESWQYLMKKTTYPMKLLAFHSDCRGRD